MVSGKASQIKYAIIDPKVVPAMVALDPNLMVGLAACMAGFPFTRVGVGYVHAIAHQLGGLYHVPHGLANAIVMPYVLEFSKPNCAHRLAELARNSDIGERGASDAELADAFIARIRKLNADMQIPGSIKELKREDFDKIIDRAFAEAHGTDGKSAGEKA